MIDEFYVKKIICYCFNVLNAQFLRQSFHFKYFKKCFRALISILQS